MEGEEKKVYKITKETAEGPQVGNSSKDFTGKALTEYPNGEIFDGYYKGGVREGFGVYSYPNGDKYEGEWANNLKHGIGKMIFTAEGEYYGRFENGKRHGEGVFTYKKTKDIYSGSWKFGKKHGKGTYIFDATKMKIVGNWVNGEIISGKWIFPNGTYFEGNFEKNKPKGLGVWCFNNGNKIHGEFNHSQVENPDSGEAYTKINWHTAAEIIDPAKYQDIL